MRNKQIDDVIEPGQSWQVDLFRPEDAEAVARLFRTVYGDNYPIRTFADPQRLREENASARTVSSVARTPKGDIVGHNALVRSAPFERIYESAAGLVAPDYRSGSIMRKLTEYSLSVAAAKFDVEGVWGEMVCNHAYVQKLSSDLGVVVTAAEIDLMPAAAYSKEKSAKGRVATLVGYSTRRVNSQTVFLPRAYEEMLRFIYDGLRHDCKIALSSEPLPAQPGSRIDTQIFGFAQVARFTVHEAAEDFEIVFDREVKAALSRGTVVHQVLLKLSWPWVGHVVEKLRSRGFFIGGALPRWFDVDGLLMQKVYGAPHWEGIQLYTDRAKRIVELVKEDWSRTEVLHGEA